MVKSGGIRPAGDCNGAGGSDSRGGDDWIGFFDRSLIDAAAALEHVTGAAAVAKLMPQHRYNPIAFFVPPWPALFGGDGERRHDLDDAIAEYERLERAYPAAGYRLVELPRTTVSRRTDLVESMLPDLAMERD